MSNVSDDLRPAAVVVGDGSVEETGLDLGRAYVVASPKGGVGKSTIAANLALAMAKEKRFQVVLVDLDAQFGDVASILNISPEFSIVDAIGALGLQDSVLMKTYLHAHDSGLVVLAAPDSPTAADHVSADQSKALVEHLKSMFPIVIVDTGAGITEQNIGALEAADELVLVATPDVAALRALKREIGVLDGLGVTTIRHLAVSLTDRRSGLIAKDVEEFMEMPAAVSVPRDPEVVLAANQGHPIVLERKQGEPAKRLSAFATALIKEKR